MPDPGKPLFLAHRSYRRRRLIDVARLVPVVATFMFLIPLLWQDSGASTMNLAGRMVYLFAVWFGAVAVAALVALRLTPEDVDKTTEGDGQGQR